MKFSVDAKEFGSVLQRVAVALPSKSPVAALFCILIKATEDGVILGATDLSFSVQFGIPKTKVNVLKTGCWAVPGKSLIDVVSMATGTLEVEFDGNMVHLTHGRSKIRLVAMPGDDYPNLSYGHESLAFSRVPSKDFVGALSSVSWSCSRDETRPILCGVCCNDKEFASTDGHRMTVLSHSLPITAEHIIPQTSVDRLSKVVFTEEVGFHFSTSDLYVLSGSALITVRLTAGKFLDYSMIMPKRNDKKVIVNRADLKESLDRALILADKEQRTAIINYADKKIVLASRSEKSGEVEDSLRCHEDSSAEPIKIGFNAKYLVEMLSVVRDDTVVFNFADGLSPLLVQEGKLRHVVMPKRI